MSIRRGLLSLAACTLALAGGALAVALPRLAREAARRRLRAACGPASHIDVGFAAHPVALLAGRLRRLEVRAEQARVGGLVIRRLSFGAERVRVDPVALLRRRRCVLSGARGVWARAVVGERALNDHLAARGVRVRLGQGSVRLMRRSLSAEGRIVARDGQVVVQVDRLRVGGLALPPAAGRRWVERLDLGLDLTVLPLPLRAIGVETRPGELTLTAVGAVGSTR